MSKLFTLAHGSQWPNNVQFPLRQETWRTRPSKPHFPLRFAACIYHLSSSLTLKLCIHLFNNFQTIAISRKALYSMWLLYDKMRVSILRLLKTNLIIFTNALIAIIKIIISKGVWHFICSKYSYLLRLIIC